MRGAGCGCCPERGTEYCYSLLLHISTHNICPRLTHATSPALDTKCRLFPPPPSLLPLTVPPVPAPPPRFCLCQFLPCAIFMLRLTKQIRH